MALTFPVVNVGGTGLTTIPIGSIIYSNAANQLVALQGASGDDGQFLRFNWNGGAPTLTWEAAAVSEITGKMIMSGDISPTQITADQNDYNPTNLSTSSVLRLTSDASRNITGLAGGEDGRVIQVHNVGSNNLVLKHESTSSTAANRFSFPDSLDVTLSATQSVSLWYDSTTSRWRTTGYGFGKLPVARGGTNSSTALNNNRIMVSSGGAIVEAAALTDGQLLIGDTGAAPVTATLTAGANITITNGPGSITIAATGGGTSPFQSSSGVITYVTSTDRLRLDVGEVGDIGLEIRGIASQTANMIDVKKLTTDTQPAFAVEPSGDLRWGPGGSTAVDCELTRNAAGIMRFESTGLQVNTPAVSGGRTTLDVIPGAHTAVTAEVFDLRVRSHTITITGGYLNQRFTVFEQPTITASSALTVTTAATVTIDGDPIASGSATLTNKYSLWVRIGVSYFNDDVHVRGLQAFGNGTILTVSNTSSQSTSGETTLSKFRGSINLLSGFTTQRFHLFEQPTVSASSSLTISDAATLAIVNAPTASGSAVITNAWALWVQGGRAKFDGPVCTGPGTTLTIASGAVTVTGSYHAIDTEGAAASDDLDTINGGKTGQLLWIRAANSARTVVVKDGTGNIRLSSDFSMDHVDDIILLVFDGTNWLQSGRSDNSI